MEDLCLAANLRFRGSLQVSRPRGVLKAQIMDVAADPISLDQNSHFEGQGEGINTSGKHSLENVKLAM